MSVALRTGGKANAMVPQTFDELQRMAKVFLISETFKPSYQASEEKAFAECCIVIQRGLDVGLSPTQAVEGIALIKGKTMIYGDTLTALLLAHGCQIKKWHEGTGTDLVGYAKIIRPDGAIIEKSYSAKQAIEARLWDDRETVTNYGKTKQNDSPWFRFKERMLEWRAFGHAFKDGASDFAKGLAIVEEMSPQSNDPIDITPALPDIPNIPDIPEPHPQKAVAVEDTSEDDEPLVDQEGFLASLEESLAVAGSPDEIHEIIEGNADLIPRLTKENQRAVADLYEGALQ